MMRRSWMLLSVALLVVAISARLVGQGVNYQVNIGTGMSYSQPFSVQAWATASAPGFPMVEIDGTLMGGAGGDYQYDIGIGYAEISLWANYEPNSSYNLSVYACADWFDGYWDCDFDFEQLTTPQGAPVLDSIDPSSGNPGQCYAFNAYGDNFDHGSIIPSDGRLDFSNQSAAFNQISATLCIDSSLPSGYYTVLINTAQGNSSPKTFTVN